MQWEVEAKHALGARHDLLLVDEKGSIARAQKRGQKGGSASSGACYRAIQVNVRLSMKQFCEGRNPTNHTAGCRFRRS